MDGHGFGRSEVSGPDACLERSGVTIEQCVDCRGVFLARGEFERLAEAEEAHYGAMAPARTACYPPATGRRRKRSGFLGDLSDLWSGDDEHRTSWAPGF